MVPKIVAPGPKSKNVGFSMVLEGFLEHQDGSKSKNVDFSLVLKAFLRHRVGTKSQNVDFSLVFKGKARRGHRAEIAPGRGRHSWREPPVSL